MQQQRITSLLSDRTKPRTFAAPPLKRQKPNASTIKPPAFKPPTITPTTAKPPTTKPPLPPSIASQKRKFRLSQILARERRARASRAPPPTFVFQSPKIVTPSPATPANTKPPLPTPIAKPAPDHALHYARENLPSSHAYLLDVLSALEACIPLLRARETRATIGALRPVVSRATKRTLTIKSLCQLAGIVPEGVAVLPGLKEGREFYIVRLDDVDEKGAFERGQGSMLGASYARLRRALLHRRLIRHVESCREQFQARMDGKEKGVSFSLERDVKEIEAVQVFSARVEKTACKKKMRKVESEVVHEGVVETQGGEEQDDGCIPESLLARVRKRERAREEHAKRVTEDEENNVSLLSMLPVTMDTICNVLRSERRTAMGWGQLIRKVSKVHPKKWGLEDVDRQMEAIVNLGKDWCSKVALKSSRGGFAFRVVSEPDFAKARQLVCATETYKA